MKTNLVIKMMLLLFLTSCSSLKHEIKDNPAQIMEAELSRHSSFYENDKVYLHFTSNEYLINFIKKNEVAPNIDNINLSRDIRPEEVQFIFNKKEVIHLTESLKNSILKPNMNSYHHNLIVDSQSKLSSIDELEKKRINLSSPTITSDNKYALISYSYGKENSMQGGINLYYNLNNEWKFYKSLEVWVE